MKAVIMDFDKCLDPDLPRILKDRFDHFIVTLYRISADDGDFEVINPSFKYIREYWLNIYKDQGSVQHMIAQGWLLQERHVGQAIRELLRGANQTYESWVRRHNEGWRFRYNYEALTDLILGEFGARAFRIQPEDLKQLLDPHSTSQHNLLQDWIGSWSPNIYKTIHGAPIQWRTDVGGWL